MSYPHGLGEQNFSRIYSGTGAAVAPPLALSLETALIGHQGQEMLAAFAATNTTFSTAASLFNYLSDGISARQEAMNCSCHGDPRCASLLHLSSASSAELGGSWVGSSMLLLGCKSPLFWAGVASIACVMVSKHLHLIADHMSCSAAGVGCAAAAALAAMRSPICALMQLHPAVRQAIGLYWTQRCLMLPIAMLNMGVSGLLQVVATTKLASCAMSRLLACCSFVFAQLACLPGVKYHLTLLPLILSALQCI